MGDDSRWRRNGRWLGARTGQGPWIEVVDANNANLRAAAATLKLTGYYRPEDAEVDREALSEGHVRFCANNTGNESQDRLWGEAICMTDGTIDEAVEKAQRLAAEAA